MKICILGAGAVGTSFAVHLALAGHDVTLVARGAAPGQAHARRRRHRHVPADHAHPRPRHRRDGRRPHVRAWDLVLVTVLAHQLDAALLGVLKLCPDSATVMFMFTTFAPLDEYRNAVGASRCVFGFPIIDARFVEPDGALKHAFISAGSRTLVTDDKWCGVLAAAGIPTNLEPADLMQSWHRTHAGLTIGMIGLMNRAAARNGGVSWAEASLAARGARRAQRRAPRWGPHHSGPGRRRRRHAQRRACRAVLGPLALVLAARPYQVAWDARVRRARPKRCFASRRAWARLLRTWPRSVSCGRLRWGRRESRRALDCGRSNPIRRACDYLDQVDINYRDRSHLE